MGRITELAEQTQATSFEVVNEYFRWLCDKVGVERPNGSYWILIKALHKKEFYWTVPNDDNRALDGKKLREAFAEETDYYPYDALDGPCSMLEMLIALAGRCQYGVIDAEVENRTSKWFWELVGNIGLDKFTDDVYVEECGTFQVDLILDTVLDRAYKKDGRGGLFPLKSAKKDQRNVEIWFQMCAYLIENYYVCNSKT